MRMCCSLTQCFSVATVPIHVGRVEVRPHNCASCKARQISQKKLCKSMIASKYFAMGSVAWYPKSPSCRRLSKFKCQRKVAIASASNNAVFVPYSPVSKGKEYDLRLLKPHHVAITPYQNRGEGFDRLGNYLSGENKEKTRFPEPQPIVMSYHGENQDKKKMQVYLEVDDGVVPPPPVHPSVELQVVGGSIIAVRKFEGNATKEKCNSELNKLRDALNNDGVSSDTSIFFLAQYGPLHSLQTRLNEIWVQVSL